MKRITFSMGLGFVLCARASFGGPILADVTETGFGTVGQGAPGINNSGVACGPTSVYNSFVYLQGLDPALGTKLTGSDAATTINTLATDMNLVPGSGISANGLVNGKTQYINDVGLSNSIVVESQIGSGNVTAQFIYDQLAAGQDVELGFTWNGATGGHVITLTGMSAFDTVAKTATLSFLDPWGNGSGPEDGNPDPTAGDLEGAPATPGTTAAPETGSLTFGGGVWTLSYVGSAAGANGGSGTLVVVAAESIAPEPSTIFLLSAGLVVLLAGRYRRRARRYSNVHP